MKQPAVLEHLHYIAKRTFKGHALFVSLSMVQNSSLPDKVIAPIRAYEQMGTCTRYVLDNKDVILFFNNNKAHHLMLLALKIKAITGTDIYEKIVSSYDLKTEYARLHNRIYNLVLAPEKNQLHSLSIMQKIPHKPFMFEELKKALNHLEGTSLTHLIRKQPILTYAPNKNGQTLCTCWFVDMSDIRRILIPDVDIEENTFFYGMLRDAVAEKVFHKIINTPNWVGGLNVSISMFRSAQMKQWLLSHTPEQRKQIFFDFAFEDVISNASDYLKIRSILSEKGYRFIMRINTLHPYINIGAPDTDYVKIPSTQTDNIEINQINPQDLIVTGVHNKDTANTLIEKGIYKMQGTAVNPNVSA